MTLPIIKISKIEHRNQDYIGLHFSYNTELIAHVKQLPGCRWSKTKRCWLLPFQDNFEKIIEQNLEDICQLEFITDDQTDENDVQQQIKQQEEDVLEIEVFSDERQKVFYLDLPYPYKDEFKKLEGAWWHPGAKLWSAIDTPANRAHLKSLFKDIACELNFKTRKEADKRFSPTRNFTQNKPGLIEPDERFERQMHLEGKSKNTIRQYKSYVSWFLSVQENTMYDIDAAEKVKSFLYQQVVKKNYGLSQQNGIISALKQYYKAVYKLELDAGQIPRPKRKRNLPKVITEEEFAAMYKVTRNNKHRIILLLLFGCGLRRQEVCDLLVSDVDFDRELIYVKGKGNKYRVVNPGVTLLKQLAKYIKSYLPDEYLIEGPDGGKYSGSSIGKIVAAAATNAGIRRRVHPHMLRHTFATLLMEKGVELRLIQEALGHSSSKTTETYTQVSRATIKKMPVILDSMKI